jgi:hypothetical protein
LWRQLLKHFLGELLFLHNCIILNLNRFMVP